MITAVMLLLLLSAIAVAGVQHAGSELGSTGYLRRGAVTFHAADGGLQVAISQIAKDPPDHSPFSIVMDDGTTVRSGARTDGVPQPLIRGGTGLPPEGYALNLGSGYVSRRHGATVLALSSGGASVELQAAFRTLEAGRGY